MNGNTLTYGIKVRTDSTDIPSWSVACMITENRPAVDLLTPTVHPVHVFCIYFYLDDFSFIQLITFFLFLKEILEFLKLSECCLCKLLIEPTFLQ